MAIENLHLPIQGMTCDHCVRSVERTLASVRGVTRVKVDLKGASADVEYDPAQASPDALAGAVRDLGYEVAS
ncbi:MAG TPA: copper ion binding protein [Candidatus Sulfopaludibacter sp.]|nr:copper ion binding protein [Candidatus Sulfopaludibacter sp.]